MSNTRQEVERAPDFYRYHYDKVVITLIVLVFLIIICASFVMYQVFHRPLPLFSATTPDGKNMSLIPSETPILIPSTLITWASKGAVAAYTFDFVNFNKQINDARPYFTSAGWNDYQNSIRGLIATITQNQLFVNGVVAGAPIISNQGELPGVGYAWRVQIPFLVTYQSSEQTTKKNFTVLITIIRVPTRENPKGIGIDQFVMR